MPEPRSRFAVMEAPMAAPGCCYLCRTANKENGPWVDTQVNKPFEGAVYICASCIRDMYAQLPEADNNAALLFKKAYHDGVQSAVNVMEAAFNDLGSTLISRIGAIDTGGEFPDVTVGPPIFPPNSDGEVEGGTSADGTDKQDKRASRKQGPNDVPDDSVDGVEFRIE